MDLSHGQYFSRGMLAGKSFRILAEQYFPLYVIIHDEIIYLICNDEKNGDGKNKESNPHWVFFPEDWEFRQFASLTSFEALRWNGVSGKENAVRVDMKYYYELQDELKKVNLKGNDWNSLNARINQIDLIYLLMDLNEKRAQKILNIQRNVRRALEL